MEKINIDIYLGDTADIAKNNQLPAGITSYNPYITWQLPKQIQQARVGIRITNINNQQLLAVFKSVTTSNYYQIPIGNGLNTKWTGLCFIQIQVSRYVDYNGKQQFQFTSGGRQQNTNGYFIIDPNIQSVSSNNAVSYMWQRSVDENVQQQLIYHLQVSKHPLFRDNDIVLNQTSIADVTTGYVDYQGLPLTVGSYFFRVRAFDGYGYSQWSDINCFFVKDFEPPILSNLKYTKTYNQTGDVIIQFDIYNQVDDYSTIILYYSYANDLTAQYPCILKQTSHVVPNGHNQLIWQTAKNAYGSENQLKMQGMQKTNIIQDVDLFLYAQPYYSGAYGQLIWTDISLDNQMYSSIITNTSNAQFKYMFRTYLMKVPKYSTHQYVGWNSDYYYTIKDSSIYLDKNSTTNYNYYKQLINSYQNKLQSDVYNRYRINAKANPRVVKYIGWNSDIYQYINDNVDLLTKGISVSKDIYQNYHQTGKFNSNYYAQYALRYDDSDVYKKQNYKGFRFSLEVKPTFALYVDGRTFRGDDLTEYTVKQKAEAGDVDSWVMGDSTSDEDEGIVVIPSYFKDARFNPKFPQQAKLPQGAGSGKDKNDKQFNVALKKLNWKYCLADGDWSYKATVKNKQTNKDETVYIKVFGGSLGDVQQEDGKLQDIVDGNVDYKQFYEQVSKYGSATLSDGQLIFQDNQIQSPQYTMYPQYYDKSGYPTGISQLYWKNVKLKDLYIRAYNIVKSGAQPRDKYQYKNFVVVPSNGIFHCYFTDKTVPQILKLKNNNLYDEQDVKCYELVREKIYQKTDKRYNDLPQFLVIYNNSGQQQLWCFNKQKEIFQQLSQDTANKIDWQKGLKDESKLDSFDQQTPLYFLTYQREYISSRGISPQLQIQCWGCKGTGKTQDKETQCVVCKGTGKTVIDQKTGKPIEVKKSPFCNVAVPQYVPSEHGVYSANGFNGKQSAFNLVSKIKRDARRYVLGHHYDWGNKQNDQKILAVLNDFKQRYYPDLQTQQRYRNTIIGFKYKWAQQGQMLEIKEKKYLYIPVRTNNVIKYAWFQDKSKQTFKVDWSSVDNDDYIFLHRDTIQPQFNITNNNFKTSKTINIKSQGTKFQYYTLTDQGYYSDKSKYGIQSYNIQGELSQYVTQTYKKDSINQFISVGRTIFLQHKNVVRDSIKITYIDDFGQTNKIYSFSFRQSTSSYNAYIVLNQNYAYIGRQLKIQYKYYIYTNYLYTMQQNDKISFTTYNDFTIIPTNKILENSIVVKYLPNGMQNNIDNYIEINNRFYQIEKNDKQQNSTFKLSFFYKDKPIKLSYNYKNKIDIPQKRYLLQQLVFDSDKNKYCIYGIDNSAINNTINLNCVDSSQRLKEIHNYSNNYGQFSVDVNSTKYSQQILKPIQIQYDYTLLQKSQFRMRFSNFVGYFMRYWINVDTIKIYYRLQNGINVDVTEYFDFYTGNLNVSVGEYSNVRMVLNTKKQSVLNQIFNNALFADYDGYTQSVYLQMMQYQSENFDSEIGYNHRLYYITQDQNGREQQIQMSTNDYKIDGNKVVLIGDDYSRIIKYIDVPIKVYYDRIVHKHNTYNSVQDSVLVVFDIQNDQTQHKYKLQLNEYYILQHSNIQSFKCYFLNQAYVLQQVDEKYYTLNGNVFVAKNEFLIGKYVFFVYQYKQFVYQNVNKIVTPRFLTQQFSIAKTEDLVINTLQLYYNITDSLSKTFTTITELWTLDIANYTNYHFYYNDNETKLYLVESQYTFENGVFSIIDNKLQNKQIFAQRNEKLKSSDYTVVQNSANSTNNVLFSNSSLLNKDIVISYNYLAATNIKSYNNNVLTQYSNKVVLSEELIKEKQQYINEQLDQNNNKIQYYDYNVDYDVIDSWSLYYCDDNCTIEDYVFDNSENIAKIIINKKPNTIQQYVQLSYSIYQGVQFKHEQTVRFSSSQQTITLDKSYVYNVDATCLIYSEVQNQYGEKQNVLTQQIVLQNEQYNIVSDQKSTVKLNNILLDKQLRISYQSYIIQKQSVQLECPNTKQSIFFTDKNITENIVVRYQKNGASINLIPKQNYSIINIQGNNYLQIQDSYFQYYKDSLLFVQYQYKYSYFNDTNNNIHYVKFQNHDRVIQLEHYGVNSVVVNYLKDDNYYQLPQQSYTYTRGQNQDNKSKITLIGSVENDKYLNKRLVISYQTRQESQCYTKTFLNDMSLAFTDRDSYVVMSHSFVVQDTFQLYYQSNKGLILIPKQHYYLDTGSQYFNAVVILNQKNESYKDYLNKRLEIRYKYIKNPRKIFNPQNQKFPYLDYLHRSNIRQGLQDYYSGYSQTQHIGYHTRYQPVYLGDQGIRIKANLKQFSAYGQYQFLFLQSFWDAYNTIHIGGVVDKSTRIILQYAPNGTPQLDSSKWKDFVGVGSVFDPQLNHYIMPPMTYDMYVDTFDQSLFETNVTYRLRMGVRGSGASSTGSSQWVYSIPFTIDHDAVNPCNITDIQFNNWTKRLSITFRIDDTQGDLYDITQMYYTSDGKSWHSISLGDVSGKLQFLQSNKRNATNLILHTVTWKTSTYNLKPATSYRVKIVANYTKYNQGDQPIFQWKTSMNPLLDYYQSKVTTLRGGKQYYKLVRQYTKEIKNEDGSVTYQQLDQPKEYWQRIKPYERQIQYNVLDQNGQPLLDQNGQPIIQKKTQIVDYYISLGEITQLNNKLQNVKNKPYKNTVQNGSYVTIPWGYREYYNEDLTQCVDTQGYNIWLRCVDTQYGQQRGSLIQQLNNLIKQKTEEAQYYQQQILYSEMNVRRNLIRQGFYSNGFLNNIYNQSDPTPFRFRVFIKPLTQSEKQYMKGLGLTMYQVKYQYQLDFNETFDSQFDKKPLRQMLSYNRNGASYQIIAGVDQQSNSSLYQGRFYLQKQKQPGKLPSDEKPKYLQSFSHSYYWRVRPFTQIDCSKKEIACCKIKAVQQKNNQIIITFGVSGQQQLGSLNLQKESNDYDGDRYYIYYKLKSETNELNVFSGNNKIDYSYEEQNDSQIVIQTQRLRDQNGRAYYYQDYFKNWISSSPKRQRPCVVIYNRQYYLFYDKPNIQSETTMYLSLSKDGNVFGQYSQIYPYNPNESLGEKQLSYLRNGFVTRFQDKFIMFANGKHSLQSHNQIYILQSDYLGQSWSQPQQCSGLTNCSYPSIMNSRVMIENKHQGQQTQITYQDIYLMLCQNNKNFQFKYSFDLIEWKNIQDLPQNYTILSDVDFSMKINKQKVQLQGVQSLQYIQYYSPYLFEDDYLYVYFGTYNNVTKEMNVYRTKYENGWTIAELIVQNAFNPCVVKDSYYGNQLHRVYFNRIKEMKYNGKMINDYVIHNVFVSNFSKDEEINKVQVNKINSTQIKKYSLDNITAGYHYKCNYCYGSGVYYDKQCQYCNGLGFVDQIQYKITISKSNIAGNFDEYDYFIKLNKNYSTKIVRKYGDWYDYQTSDMLDQLMSPKPNYRFLDV